MIAEEQSGVGASTGMVRSYLLGDLGFLGASTLGLGGFVVVSGFLGVLRFRLRVLFHGFGFWGFGFAEAAVGDVEEFPGEFVVDFDHLSVVFPPVAGSVSRL